MRIENEIVKLIISRWYEKSKNATQQPDDVFDRFISLWIAFNAYYAVRNPRVPERAQLEWVRSAHKKLFPSIVRAHNQKFEDFKKYIEDKLNNSGFIKDLRYAEVDKEEYKKRYQNLESLCEYLECVYQIRCNLFHGGKNLVDAQDKKLVELALSTLTVFLEEILKQEGIIKSVQH